VAQLRAKRTALLAVAAPTLLVFVGVVLTMLHNPVPDTWLWAACWAIALALLLRSNAPVGSFVKRANAGAGLASISVAWRYTSSYLSDRHSD
jgi:hypothetical protein